MLCSPEAGTEEWAAAALSRGSLSHREGPLLGHMYAASIRPCAF